MRKLALSCPLIPLSSSAHRLVFSHPVIPSVLCFQQTPLPLFLFLFCIQSPSLNLSVFSVSFLLFFFLLLVKCSVLLVKWSGACRLGGGHGRVGDSGVRHKAPRERQKLRERERETDGMRWALWLVSGVELRTGSWGSVENSTWNGLRNTFHFHIATYFWVQQDI